LDVRALEEKGALAGDALVRRKLGLLNFLAAAGVGPQEALLPYLAAAVDPGEQISRYVVTKDRLTT
jgi:hypothetical protein